MPGADPRQPGAGDAEPAAGTSKDFKDRISPAAIAGLAGLLENAWPEFPAKRFEELATDGLADLELKARVAHVAGALASTLPEEFQKSAAVIDRALEQPEFDGWMVYPVDDYVARCGIGYPEISLPLIARLTSRWSCEFAIRPFIEEHPEITFEYFDRWVESGDEHRRRLVSEGSRPRLPWGGHLRRFRDDPAPVIDLLDRLADDPSPYVRKSVANNLNDISKDHPELAVETGRRWQAEEPESGRRRWIVAHGMRSLVKQGSSDALALLGYDPDARVRIFDFTVEPGAIRIGEAITISFSLMAREPTPVMVDYLVHHAGAKATRGPKVFRLKTAELEPGVSRRFVKRHRIREVSVRRIYPGPHRVEVQVNGRVLVSATVEVTAG